MHVALRASANYTRNTCRPLPIRLKESVGMPKALTISGLVVSALLILVFGADLAIGVPLGGVSKLMDSLFVVAAAILGYMSWSSFREQA